MAHGTFEVTDADAHYLDHLADLTPYMEEPWKSRIENNRNLLPSTTGDRTVYGRVQREDTDYHGYKTKPEEIPAIMDRLGFDNIVLLSQQMLTFPLIEADDERMARIAGAYVEYLLDQVVDRNEGIYTMIPVPHKDIDAAVDLIEEFGDEKEIVGICFETAGGEPPLGNRRYDPIYELAQKKDLTVNFHAGGAGLNELQISGFERLLETHTLGFLFHNMAVMTSILVQGVPVKFPDLQIAFQESGIGWVPMMMNRLDAGYLKRQSEAPLLEKRPSTYMKEFYYGTQPLEIPNEAELERTIEAIGGPERLLYASDYPHWDYDGPEVITDLSFLSDEEKQMILSDNAKEVFGI